MKAQTSPERMAAAMVHADDLAEAQELVNAIRELHERVSEFGAGVSILSMTLEYVADSGRSQSVDVSKEAFVEMLKTEINRKLEDLHGLGVEMDHPDATTS